MLIGFFFISKLEFKLFLDQCECKIILNLICRALGKNALASKAFYKLFKALETSEYDRLFL